MRRCVTYDCDRASSTCTRREDGLRLVVREVTADTQSQTGRSQTVYVVRVRDAEGAPTDFVRRRRWIIDGRAHTIVGPEGAHLAASEVQAVVVTGPDEQGWRQLELRIAGRDPLLLARSPSGGADERGLVAAGAKVAAFLNVAGETHAVEGKESVAE